jgi:hypothetical protein
MATIYVAASKALGEWAEEVGLTKHVYKVGVTEDSADEAVKALNAQETAGQTDWKLLAKGKGDIEEDAALERLARKEKAVDPTLYPKLRDAKGIFKVKTANVENAMLVKHALEGGDPKVVKMKPADIGAYLVRNALG